MDFDKQKASKVYIEISGICNAKCPYCAQRRIKDSGHSGGLMNPDLFEHILAHLFETKIISQYNVHHIALFNWGEPLLNPELNKILQILKKRKLNAQISSNFSIKPDIDKECFPVISDITFSLSGFSQDTYGSIHGLSLDNALSNFNYFYTKCRKYSPRTHIRISWHRYLFNENELWDAYRYFNRPLIDFNPTVAFMNDFVVMIEFLSRWEFPADKQIQMEKDIFLKHIYRGIEQSKKKSKKFHCPGWDSLVIDETGQLLLCCGVNRFDSEHVLGNVLEMSAKNIWEKKLGDFLCNECISSGLAMWYYNQNPYNNMQWPSGGGTDNIKAWLLYNLRPRIGRILRKFPDGDRFINIMKKFHWN